MTVAGVAFLLPSPERGGSNCSERSEEQFGEGSPHRHAANDPHPARQPRIARGAPTSPFQGEETMVVE